MGAIQLFTFGWVTPAFAYGLSFLGSFLGLAATARARISSESRVRSRWLVLAAWSIGGTGIWAMHFVAMIGFSVTGSAVRFDVPTTIASWLIAVIVVGVGLFIVGYGTPSVFKVGFAGLLTGLGVAAMHYTGMSAMRVNGSIGYDRTTVLVSIVIAVVAATAALWVTVVVHRLAALLAASAIMAVAVNGMHFTGMTAMHVHLNATPSDLAGLNPLSFLVPVVIFVLLVVIALGYALLAAPSEADLTADARLREVTDRGGWSSRDVYPHLTDRSRRSEPVITRPSPRTPGAGSRQP